ncbi:MAG: DUF2007 domain-containing protein [Pseudomonadota bacterium]
MKIIYKANDIIEAHIVAGFLQSHEIQTFVGGHYLQGGVGELVPFGFATVSVHDGDIGAAEALMREYDQVSTEQLDAEISALNPLLAPGS